MADFFYFSQIAPLLYAKLIAVLQPTPESTLESISQEEKTSTIIQKFENKKKHYLIRKHLNEIWRNISYVNISY